MVMGVLPDRHLARCTGVETVVVDDLPKRDLLSLFLGWGKASLMLYDVGLAHEKERLGIELGLQLLLPHRLCHNLDPSDEMMG
jgi:hypothetical protein